MELDKLFTELWQNLYKSFIFYIPERLMPDLDNKDALNMVILIDNQGFDSELNDQVCNHVILGKSMVLNENIFKLIDISERLKKEQFNFFLDKYLEHINFVVYVSDWMQKHVEDDIKDLRSETIQAFESQIHVFLKHVEDLKSHIIIPDQALPNQEVNVFEFIENDLTDIKKALNINSDSPNTIIEKAIEPVPIKSKKKLPLLTDEEAEAFLLESIFNIKFFIK